MAILIEGMEMPKEYGRCMVIFPDGRVTTEFGSQVIATAVPVPPHGRLIDADAMAELWKGCKIEGSIKPLLDTRPTVIEAEEDE